MTPRQQTRFLHKNCWSWHQKPILAADINDHDSFVAMIVGRWKHPNVCSPLTRDEAVVVTKQWLHREKCAHKYHDKLFTE